MQYTYNTSNIQVPYPIRRCTVFLTPPECHKDALVFPGFWNSDKSCTAHVIDRRGALGM